MLPLHKSGCQKRKERQKHIMNEKKGMRMLFDVGVAASNLNDNEQEDTVSKANDVDKISDDLTDCFDGEKIETFEDNEDDSNGIETVSLSASNCGQVILDIGNLLSEIPSQSEIENYVTNDHVNFPNILPKDINNQAFLFKCKWSMQHQIRHIQSKQHSYYDM